MYLQDWLSFDKPTRTIYTHFHFVNQDYPIKPTKVIIGSNHNTYEPCQYLKCIYYARNTSTEDGSPAGRGRDSTRDNMQNEAWLAQWGQYLGYETQLAWAGTVPGEFHQHFVPRHNTRAIAGIITIAFNLVISLLSPRSLIAGLAIVWLWTSLWKTPLVRNHQSRPIVFMFIAGKAKF